VQITNIEISAGRTFNHPREQYSNLRPEVRLTASLEPGEDVNAKVQELQAKAEKLVEDHKNNLLAEIESLHELTEHQAELVNLETNLRRAQERIEEIRRDYPALKQLQLPQP
jgi:chromosome segregation ATPase